MPVARLSSSTTVSERDAKAVVAVKREAFPARRAACVDGMVAIAATKATISKRN